MDPIDKRDHAGSHKRSANQAMRDAAMVLQTRNRAPEIENRINVRGFKCQHQRERCQCGFSIQSGAAHAGAGQHMRDRIQGNTSKSKLAF